ncbi:phage tail tape measure protein [Comamonas thiooxydans]|uniref:phage tail tape measure protein n=1 Tax=Comamonas thiooxydans TaxID=363952 RepID=UPI0009B87EAB|nr:phage tail tape measure protein [Comamonas thiooxydans]
MADESAGKLQLPVTVDSTGARQGFQEVSDAGRRMADDIAAAGRKASDGLKPLETDPQKAAAAISRAERNMVGSIQRATVAMQSGGKAGSEYYEILAKQRGISADVLKPYIDQLRQAEAAQKRLSQSGQYVMSDRAHSAAMRGVPAQFQDIIVSLQGGQNAMTVFLQQGSQLMSMFGGAGEAAKALGGYVLGLVNPFTLTAVAAGVLSYGLYSGAKEAHAFLVVLQKTGNQAGTSVQQLVDMSAAMDDVAGITQAKAAEALVTFAANAGVGADRLQRYTTTAIEWERATGQSVEEVAKEFKKLGEDPVKAVLELNKQMDFLTSATFEQIKSLQEVGRETDAARVAQDAYDSAIAGATSTITANLGLVEKGWIAIRNVGAEVIDMIKSLGRQEGMHAVVERLQKEVNDYQDRGPTNSVTESTGSYAKGLKTRQNRLDKAREMLGLSESANTYVQGSRERERALINLSAEASKHYDKQTQKRLELAAAEKKYGEAAKTSAEAQKQYDLLVAGINKKYEEKEKKGVSTAPTSRRLDLSEIQNAAREEVRIIDGKQKDLDRLRQSGLIDDQGYYSQKRSLIEESSKVEETALQEQIARLQQEKVKGSDALAVKKQIADTESKLAAKRLETGEKLKSLSFEETLATDRQRMAMESLAGSHKRSMEQMREQQQRTISSAWMGAKDRQRAESIWSIKDSYLAEERNLRDRRMYTANLSKEQQAQIDQRLADLKAEKEERIRIAEATYAELDQLQTRWELGAGFAMQNYVDQAANVAQQSADAFSNAFRGIEDALVKFVMTGKLSFTDLANNIVADITRIIIKQQLSNALGVAGSGGSAGSGLMGLLGQGLGLLTGASSAGSAGWGDYSAEGLAAAFGAVPNALGGVYDSHSLSAYRNQIHDTPQFFAFAKGAGVFGEAGPEAIMPLTRAPDGNLGVRALSTAAGGTTNINVTVPMPQGGSRETALQFGRTAGRQIAIAQSRNG